MVEVRPLLAGRTSIGIGDGGNEIGMGKLPLELLAAHIPNGAKIACRVPTDYLIVAGLSNWGAYALALGTALARGVSPTLDLQRERQILADMVAAGLIDGVTGQATLSVDGLAWDEYMKPLGRLREQLA
ncbi:MAG: glutamate cyclase domain-containing protein, partial [Gemmataceae bacterium]